MVHFLNPISEWCPYHFFFFFFLTGMYHVFLLVKDGFFHITNLALAKIETGIKHHRVRYSKVFLEQFVYILNNHSSIVFTAIEKMDLGALKEVSWGFFSFNAKAKCIFQKSRNKIPPFLYSAAVSHQDRLLLHKRLPWRGLQYSSDVQPGQWNQLPDWGQYLRKKFNSFIYDLELWCMSCGTFNCSGFFCCSCSCYAVCVSHFSEFHFS